MVLCAGMLAASTVIAINAPPIGPIVGALIIATFIAPRGGWQLRGQVPRGIDPALTFYSRETRPTHAIQPDSVRLIPSQPAS